MNAFNATPLVGVGAWLYEGVAGIAPDPDAPGFRRFRVAPRPGGGLSWARASHASPYGAIECAWRLVDGALQLDLSVPAGTTASVRLPVAAGSEVHEGTMPAERAEGVRLIERGEQEAAYEVGAGSYRFVVAGMRGA